MPPRGRSLLDHLAEGSWRGRYQGLLLTEALPEAPPTAYAMIDGRVGPLWSRLVRAQDAFCAASGSPAAGALGLERYRAALLSELSAAARELSRGPHARAAGVPPVPRRHGDARWRPSLATRTGV